MWAVMVAAVRVRRPQKVRAPFRTNSVWSVISLKVGGLRQVGDVLSLSEGAAGSGFNSTDVPALLFM
jgi:hypothetical protein